MLGVISLWDDSKELSAEESTRTWGSDWFSLIAKRRHESSIARMIEYSGEAGSSRKFRPQSSRLSGRSNNYFNEFIRLCVLLGDIVPRLALSFDSSTPDCLDGGLELRLPGVNPEEEFEPCCSYFYCCSYRFPFSIKITRWWLLSPAPAVVSSGIPSVRVIELDTLRV